MLALMDFTVAQQSEADWPEVWRVLEPAFHAGESYPLPRDVTEADAKTYWIKKDGYNGVARDNTGGVIGVYYLRPDQGGPGAHVCNAGYVIAETARGHGYAAKLCIQSQEQARALGYLAMKFNLVVSANAAAVRAWRRAGMDIIATVPNAFRLPDGELSDAFIMYRDLSA
ncbi:N-acetyltransferase family protein [Hyphococcus sp.]|uniref:GNAT family N-acetyltransferase n=1 Tax=Hyphococcus sp. TaxID=2038636 RepID=UPI003CCB86BA